MILGQIIKSQLDNPKLGKIDITALPIGCWTEAFKKKNQGKQYVQRIRDNSSSGVTAIEVKLTTEGNEYFSKIQYPTEYSVLFTLTISTEVFL